MSVIPEYWATGLAVILMRRLQIGCLQPRESGRDAPKGDAVHLRPVQLD